MPPRLAVILKFLILRRYLEVINYVTNYTINSIGTMQYLTN